MKSKDRIIIQKIISYIDDVEKYVEGLQAKEFMDDKKTITACAFTVSQIGELVKEVDSEMINKYTDIPWNSIKGSLPDLKDKFKDIILNEKDVIF